MQSRVWNANLKNPKEIVDHKALFLNQMYFSANKRTETVLNTMKLNA